MSGTCQAQPEVAHHFRALCRLLSHRAEVSTLRGASGGPLGRQRGRGLGSRRCGQEASPSSPLVSEGAGSPALHTPPAGTRAVSCGVRSALPGCTHRPREGLVCGGVDPAGPCECRCPGRPPTAFIGPPGHSPRMTPSYFLGAEMTCGWDTRYPARTLAWPLAQDTMVSVTSTSICHNYPISQAAPLLWPAQACVLPSLRREHQGSVP